MAPSRTSAVPWPLVGRVDELDLIGRHRSQGSCAVVIAGSAGVGKTRLARLELAPLGREETDRLVEEISAGRVSAVGRRH
jgi:hypothetical protein